MQSDYTFLTDHSYSIRVDYDKLPLKQREMKNKKRRGNSISSRKTSSPTSIHRSSSDKENNSSNPIDVSVIPKINKTKKNRTKPRTASTKKQSTKSNSKSNMKSLSNKIIQKKTSSMNLPDTTSILPSLSIEERVKLRRTAPLLAPPIQPITTKKSLKRIHFSKTKKEIIKPKKFFLGSGLDLDNIVAGNRQRRSIQT
ncbi:hypothetical protein I4U23_001792 [Adineta vaga]|nr:hypothetical protein I4U23_001792 [Adineta vaga]